MRRVARVSPLVKDGKIVSSLSIKFGSCNDIGVVAPKIAEFIDILFTRKALGSRLFSSEDSIEANVNGLPGNRIVIESKLSKSKIRCMIWMLRWRTCLLVTWIWRKIAATKIRKWFILKSNLEIFAIRNWKRNLCFSTKEMFYGNYPLNGPHVYLQKWKCDRPKILRKRSHSFRHSLLMKCKDFAGGLVKKHKSWKCWMETDVILSVSASFIHVICHHSQHEPFILCVEQGVQNILEHKPCKKDVLKTVLDKENDCLRCKSSVVMKKIGMA